MNTLKYNPELQEKKIKIKNRTPSIQRRNKLVQLATETKPPLPQLKSFSGQGDTWQKMSTELKTKRNETKHVVLNYIDNKTLPPSSVYSTEAMGDSSQLPLTKEHNFEASKMISGLSIRADLEPHFHTFHSNATTKCVASIQISDPGKGTKYFPRSLNGIVMSEQQADLNWHNTETPMSLHWKAWTRAQLQTHFSTPVMKIEPPKKYMLEYHTPRNIRTSYRVFRNNNVQYFLKISPLERL